MTGNRFSAPLAACVALAWLFALAGAASAQNPRAFTEAPLPRPEGFYKYVTDTAGVLDAATKERLATVLNRLKERADIEFAVVTVPTTGETDVFEYSLSLARGWGVGSNEGEKNGLLLLVAVNDRKWQVQVSRHLEGDLPDSLAGQIARQRLVPPLKQGNYGQGIDEFVTGVIATLAQKRGFEIEGIDRSYAYRESAPRTRTTTRAREASGVGLGTCCLIIFVVIVLLAMAGKGGRGGRGGRGGWGGGGGGGGLLTSILVANAIGSAFGGGRQSSSGWGGGGGGGGGFGGFGGGGDFGGGGAGGSW
ncbi:MAG TPA: TPM domain-containing protein [Pyrinomonadaceae bacterium]